MRVLTGESKGKRLRVPRGGGVRPTSARVKKSIFDVLGDSCPGARVLDLFSGSGSLGIEALSLGADFSAFVEKNPAAARAVSANLASCGYSDRARILNFDFRKALSILRAEGEKFDLVFMDPPYEFHRGAAPLELALEVRGIVAEKGIMIVEHSSGDSLESGHFETRTRRYGGTSVSFLRRPD